MLFVALVDCCLMLFCVRYTFLLFVVFVCCLWFLVVFFVVRVNVCLLVVGCLLLIIVCGVLLYVVCCMLFAVCCLFCVVGCS